MPAYVVYSPQQYNRIWSALVNAGVSRHQAETTIWWMQNNGIETT